MTMKRTILSAAALLVSASALPFAASAVAQDAGTSADTVRDVVTVTARRREESLKDVPVAVSALSADQLDQIGAQDITTLQAITPNATVQVARGSNSTLISFIRGVGQQDPLWGFGYRDLHAAFVSAAVAAGVGHVTPTLYSLRHRGHRTTA